VSRLVSPDTFHRRLRSAEVERGVYVYTPTRFVDRSFTVAGPRLWNSLPTSLRRI